VLETLENRHAHRDYLVRLDCPEVTSICPLTGAPDFGRLTVRYVPDEALVELKSLRDHLTGYRERAILQEELVNEVLDLLVQTLSPRYLEVSGEFNARGGIGVVVTARAGVPPELLAHA
jgi:7-cyano-7-deazaguanine reductase